MSADVRVAADDLRRLAQDIFGSLGMEPADAGLLAESLVAADLRGVHSHGTIKVAEYVGKMRGGAVLLGDTVAQVDTKVDPRGRPAIVKDNGACIVVDGRNSMGQIGTQFAMEQVIERADRHGIAAAAIRGSNHNGTMAWYVEQAIRAGQIGIATTNTLPLMAPWGGNERLLGINPLGIGVPSNQPFPVVYDGAFTNSAFMKIKIMKEQGLPIPDTWATDREGRPTTDPAEALLGVLQPSGGHKGVALAVMMGFLSSMLSGALYGRELGTIETGPKAGGDGHFVLALKVAAFEDLDTFKRRVDGAIDEIHACRLAAGVTRTYAPGEVEYLNSLRQLREGVSLVRSTFARLNALAAERGLAPLAAVEKVPA